MASKPVELPLSTWAPPASPLRIEYSNEVMEEIRARAVEGFYKLSRGGVEIAGLLLGSVQHDSIRVLAQLPFEIEYAFGPVFALSPRDVAYVRKLIEDVSSAAIPDSNQGKNYRVLGLYVSHSRSGMVLSEEEIHLVEQLFPHAWQAILVMKPSRASETAATFFVRERSGELQGNQPYGQFTVRPAMGERRSRPAPPAESSLLALADASRNASDRNAPTASDLTTPPEIARRNSPAVSPLAALSQEDVLARRALPEIPPVPLPGPPPVPASLSPESQAEAISMEQQSPAAAVPEISDDAARDLEILSLPRPLAAPVVEPDAPAAQPPDVPAIEPPDAVSDSPEWHEEERPAPQLRATSWLRWAIPSVGLLLLLVLGFLIYQAFNSAPPTVVFYTRDTGANIEVFWQLKGLSDARSAVITVKTGDETRRIDLIRTGQLSGTYRDPFLQRTSDVTLDIERASGAVLHRSAPLIPADSVVAYLGGAGTADSGASVTTEPESSNSADGTGAERPSEASLESSRSVHGPEPILATPVETAPKPAAPTASVPSASAASPSSGATTRITPPASRGENEARSVLPGEGIRQQTARPVSSAASPEAPVQARITEAPPTAGPGTPRSETTASANASLRPDTRPQVGLTPATQAPANLQTPLPAPGPTQSSPSLQSPPPVTAVPVPVAPRTTATKPAAARVSAGRTIWTGQLRKNQSLEINGNGASLGVVNTSLPGQPVRVSVLPGELTPQGLVVYTSNPRYRDAQNAVEPPGPTNGWNQTRYRYDPVRAHSLIVIGSPSAANGWQGVTVRNDDKTTNVIVIDWQAAEP